MTRAIGYLRVSTDEQQTGIEVQRGALLRYAESHALTLTSLAIDEGLSGGTMHRRPALLEALEDLKAGRADALLCSKMDRLSRSVKDFCDVIDQSRRFKWRLIVMDAEFDTSTPAGEMMISVLAVFGQFERRIIGQRVKDALAVKRSQGVILGRRSSVTPEIMAAISAVSHLSSFAQMANALNGAKVPTPTGVGSWHPMTISRILAKYSATLSIPSV